MSTAGAKKGSKKKGQRPNVAYIAEMNGAEEDAIKLDLFPGETRAVFPGMEGGQAQKSRRYDDENLYGTAEEAPGILTCLQDGIPAKVYATVAGMCFIGWVISAVSLNFESCVMTPFAGAHTHIVLAAQVMSWLWLIAMGALDYLGIDTLVPLSTRFCVASFLSALAVLGSILSFGKMNGDSVAICIDEDPSSGGCTKFVSCEFCECFATGGECVILGQNGEVQFDGVVHDEQACTTYQAGIFFGSVNAALMIVVSFLAFRVWTNDASKPPTEIVRQLVSLTQSEIKNMQGRTYSTVATNAGDTGLQNTNPDDDTML